MNAIRSDHPAQHARQTHLAPSGRPVSRRQVVALAGALAAGLLAQPTVRAASIAWADDDLQVIEAASQAIMVPFGRLGLEHGFTEWPEDGADSYIFRSGQTGLTYTFLLMGASTPSLSDICLTVEAPLNILVPGMSYEMSVEDFAGKVHLAGKPAMEGVTCGVHAGAGPDAVAPTFLEVDLPSEGVHSGYLGDYTYLDIELDDGARIDDAVVRPDAWARLSAVPTDASQMGGLGFATGGGDDRAGWLAELLSKTPSTTYNPRLAFSLMKLADEAYFRNGETAEQAQKRIHEALENVGITESTCYEYYQNLYDPRYGSSSEYFRLDPANPDAVAFTIGRGQTTDGRPLVVIVIRGTNGNFLQRVDEFTYSLLGIVGGLDVDLEGLAPEWKSDLNLGDALTRPGHHYGFYCAMLGVQDVLYRYLGTDDPAAGDTVYVTCGHSRGAAVSNLLAFELIRSGEVPKERVWSYNFACPDTVHCRPTQLNQDGAYGSIWNIGNAHDIVSMVPGALGSVVSHTANLAELSTFDSVEKNLSSLRASWGKYGNSYWFCDDWLGVGSTPLSAWQHAPEYYLDYLEQLHDVDEFKTYGQMKATAAFLDCVTLTLDPASVIFRDLGLQ